MSNNYIVINGKRAELTEDQLRKLGIAAQKTKPLGSFAPGSTVKIDDREYVVLERSENTTAVITKKFVTSMTFGNSGDYIESDVRKFCNREFYKELVDAVGAENILEHEIDLEADDGTGKGQHCWDNVSLLTAQRYRKYREFLPAYGEWCWTATRVTAEVDTCTRYVCYVNSDGVLTWGGCDYSRGVRPFCILDSSILVFCD